MNACILKFVQQSLLLKSEKRDEKMLSGEPESLHSRCVEISVVFRLNRAAKKKSACSGEIFTGTQGQRECAAENSLRDFKLHEQTRCDYRDYEC